MAGDALKVLREAVDHVACDAEHGAALCPTCGARYEALARIERLVEAAKRANGDHVAPYDCYTTGPLTGNAVLDLVACPGCELKAALSAVLGEEG